MNKDCAAAIIQGGKKYPDTKGSIEFCQTEFGVLITVQVYNLPVDDAECKSGVFAVHIHDGEECTGNSEDEFANAKEHYNPNNCPHPYHAGDLPPLFSCSGFTFMQVLISRFTVDEIVGKTVIIHANLDDFETQPGGNAGEKIACGEIKRVMDLN